MSDSQSEPAKRGIFELAAGFAAIYDQIALGVKEAMPRDVDPDQWADVFEVISIRAWNQYCLRPQYFSRETARRWASCAARRRRIDDERSEQRRTARQEAFAREYLAGNCGSDLLEAITEDERDRAIVRAFRSLSTLAQAVTRLIVVDGRSRREAAAELGVTERKARRTFDEARAQLAQLLGDWAPKTARNDEPKPKNEGGYRA